VNAIIAAVETRVQRLLGDGDALLVALEECGWKDSRPPRIKAHTTSREAQLDELLYGEEKDPGVARVPAALVEQYQQWYAGCLALVEVTMPARRGELTHAYRGAVRTIGSGPAMLHSLDRDYITFEEQTAIARTITQIKAIVGAAPYYLEGRLHDIELKVAQAYVGDQLGEAQVLLCARHVRSAGAVAGVLLERHLKLLCDRRQPPIAYPRAAAIAKLNDLLRDEGVYDTAQWRRVQWMGDIRNSCDHAGTTEPRMQDVSDLIDEVKKFVALFVM